MMENKNAKKQKILMLQLKLQADTLQHPLPAINAYNIWWLLEQLLSEAVSVHHCQVRPPCGHPLLLLRDCTTLWDPHKHCRTSYLYL